MIQPSANCILRLPAIKRTSESTKQIGRYLLFDEHKIGEGKFGQVYLACEEEAFKKMKNSKNMDALLDGETLACKIMPVKLA